MKKILFPIAEAEKMVNNFLIGRLGKDEFTHEAHLITGLYMLAHHGDGTMNLLRKKIADFLASIGVENTDSSGYHETLTRFWLWLLKNVFGDETGQVQWNQDVLDELVASEKLADRNIWLRHYSKDRMMSVEARRNFIEPDLESMD